MINYKRIQFASAPRTGSTYFMKAAAIAGLGEGFKAHVHKPFPEEPNAAVLRISMVRHPVDWLISYYTAIFPGSTGIEEVDALLTLPGQDFDEFAYHYLERMPGHVNEVFDRYRSNTNLRIEDAPWNVIEMFESITKLTEDQTQRIVGLGKQNISKTLPFVGRKNRLLLGLAEKKTMEKYDYCV